MAFGKHLRHDKRLPLSCMTCIVCVFVAISLFAVWVRRAPSEILRDENTELVMAERNTDVGKYNAPTGLVGHVENAPKNQDDKKDESVRPEDGHISPKDKSDALEDGEKGDPVDKKDEQEIFEEEADFQNKDPKLDNLYSEEEREIKDNTYGDQDTGPSKGKQEPVFRSEPQDISSKEESNSDDRREKQQDLSSERSSEESKDKVSETLPSVAQADLTTENNGVSSTWVTQATESSVGEGLNNTGYREDSQPPKEPLERDVEKKSDFSSGNRASPLEDFATAGEEMSIRHKRYEWELCKWTGSVDYIPCLDNKKAIKKLKSRRHFEHRERHCPTEKSLTLCLVPLPNGYKLPIRWPKSRDEIWFNNVPHPKLVTYKEDQKWMTKADDRLLFPGGGTQFKDGALQYILYLESLLPEISWGKRTRVVLDIGCGVASFGGYLFGKDVITMSFAPNDEHEAQVQLALERGIPAFLSVMGTQRLVFPSNVYDVAHCARCRVHWHAEGAKLLLEINRVLRPGGYFIWSATPVYRTEPEEVQIWKEVETAALGMCWKLAVKNFNTQTGVGVAIFRKPKDNSCFEERTGNKPPFCEEDDNSDAAWYVRMKSCLHKIPDNSSIHGAESPLEWPIRLEEPPTWLSTTPVGLYGEDAVADFKSDTDHWKHTIEKSYLQGLGINWEEMRNVLDMKAGYGGFSAALAGLPVWVMNVIPVDEPDTLAIIFDRGLIGLYHDWCESFNTYPRTYDLLHADHLFLKLRKRCGIKKTLVEVDRILRPEGWVIFRDKHEVFGEIEAIAESLHWEIRASFRQEQEKLLVIQKKMWRPST